MRPLPLSFLLVAAAVAGCAGPLPGAPLPVSGPGVECSPQPYPFQALQNWQRGQVIVRSQAGPDGRLERPFVEQAAASDYLNVGAMQAMQHCRVPGAPAGSQVRLMVVYDFIGSEDPLPKGVVSVVPAPTQP
jgi:TonB family protein